MDELVWWPDVDYATEHSRNVAYLKSGVKTIGAVWLDVKSQKWVWDEFRDASPPNKHEDVHTEEEAKAMLIALVTMGG